MHMVEDGFAFRKVSHRLSQLAPLVSKHASGGEMHIGRMRDGTIVEHWGLADTLGMLQQLGAIPTM